jgi:hypothetical protein
MKIRTDDIQINNLQGYTGNLLTIDSQGNIISSSENFNNYITKSETAAISAYLQNEIDNISGTNIEVNGGYGIQVIEAPTNTFTISVSGSFGDATLRSEVENITAVFDLRLDNLESQPAPDIFRAEVSDISGYLQEQINGISPVDTTIILGGSGISVVESPNDTFTVSVSGDYATVSQVESLTGSLQNQITTITSLSSQFSGDKVFTDNVTVNGDLIVSGTQFIVNTESISAKDNIIYINAGEVGAGVTNISAGLLVDRGSLTDYAIIFDELTDTFKVGQINDLQPVATRENSPINGGVAVWNSGANRFDTSTEYIKSVDVASVSGNLQTQINSFNVIGVSGARVVESPSNVWMVSITGDYASTSYVQSASANAYNQSVSYTNNQVNILQTQINTITGATHIILGEINLNTSTNLYTVTHDAIENPHPMINVVVPTSGSDLILANIHNITSTGFNVILSAIPPVSGYKISYIVGILNGYDGTAFQTLSSSSNVTLNLRANETIGVLDGLDTDCTFATSYLNPGNVYGLRLRDNGVSRTVYWPNGWSWMTAAPSATTASKWMVVTMESLGSNDSNVLVDWKGQP